MHAFQESTSSCTLNVERFENQIILKSLGAIKPKVLNWIAKIGYGYLHSCSIYAICVCLRIVVSNTFFVLRTMLPVSLDCPYLIAPSVFLNVYFPVSLDCPCLIAPSVFSNIYFPVSLDCPCLIAPSIFPNVYSTRYVPHSNIYDIL